MSLRVGVIVFPGSNCDRDVWHVLSDIYEIKTDYLWHADPLNRDKYDALILPGGFSFGDYLRAGALAKFSRILEGVYEFAELEKPVLGICNGFQILLECGLIPGAMMRNNNLKFVCDWCKLRLENSSTPFTIKGEVGALYRMPVAHMEGNYMIDSDGLKALEASGQVVFRYEGYNPNGSIGNIAGITNAKGNVLGMMPHPERCCDPLLGGTDGRLIFDSLVSWLSGEGAAGAEGAA